MTEVISLSALRLTRGHLKGSLTKLVTYSQSINESISLEELEVKLQKANDLWKEFNASQTRLYEFADAEGYADPVPDFEEFEAKILMVKSIFLSAIRERERADRDKNAVSRLADQQHLLIQAISRNQSNSDTKTSDFFLPQIRIEPFTGDDYRDWPAFRDMFETAVHNKPHLTPIQKFHFLKSCLRGNALKSLNNFTLCDATYDQAWERLEKKYDRPRSVINSYITAFMELPSVRNINISILRKISDGADEIVRGLTSLNSVNRDPWLIHILMSKLDPETRQAWTTEIVSEDYPTINQFLDFLERRCEALESSKIHVREPNKLRNPIKSMHATSPTNCVKCSAAHGLPQCQQFLEMSVQSRRDFVKSNKLCFNCLRSGHSSARCQSKFRCRCCNTRHHSLVHDPSANNLTTSSNNNIRNSLGQGESIEFIPRKTLDTSNRPSTSAQINHFVNNHSVNSACKIPQTLLPTAIGKVLDIYGMYQEVRILIDTGSQVSFVTESCVQRLGLKRKNSRIPICGIGSTTAGKSRGLTTLVICPRFDSLCISVDTFILSCVTTNLPTTSFTVEDWDHLQELNLADPTFNSSKPVDILLGADKAWEILKEDIVHSQHGYPIARQTIFGWVLAGKLPSNTESTVSSHHTIVDIDSILQSFWTIEEVDPKSIMSSEDKEIENHFNQTHCRDSNGRYIVKLPFKTPPTFADTLSGAVSRLSSMERKFSKSPDLFNSYSQFLDEYLNLGHMSEVPNSEVGKPNVFYLPHHAVLKPDSASTKLRVVFDGSFRDIHGNSLNDSLMIGPPIQRNLFSVCIRFRRFKFVFTADIVKMFRQILVTEKDSDFQRIVWRKSPSEPLKHFRLRTVTYGTSCAPYLSVRTLEQLANDYKDDFPIASETVLNDFYVDDVASGADTLEEAIFKRDSLIELLLKCGMQLSKWQSNCVNLTQTDGKLSRDNISLDTEADSWVKVLGLCWNSKSDIFSFQFNYAPSERITKRQILKDVARIFDPLGFLSPSVVQLKILFQELWHRKLNWDDTVPNPIAAKWSTYRDELALLTKIQIPRIIGLNNVSFELHGFSDASASAYAAVIYSRYQHPDGSFETNIVAAKSRVAPIKQLSIPRLELCGALLLARLIVSVQNSLNITFAKVYAWSDSKVVLSWLSSPPRRWNVFIGNRTAEILNTIPRNRWFHVKSQCNPADCASRGIPPSQLMEHSIWWTGPQWLRENYEHWPIENSSDEDPNCKTEEKRNSTQSYHLIAAVHPFDILSKRISSWFILIRSVARIHRFVTGCRESYATIPEPMIDVPTNRLTCWHMLQSKIQGYWKRWQAEYLTSLQQRPRWQQITPNIKINDLVVIKESNLPPGKWAMGRVVAVHPGKDGHVRVVTLSTASGNLVRPIHKLALLPVS